MTVRRLSTDEVDVLRGARLLALQDAPDAFGLTCDEELERGVDGWRGWLATGALFVAEDGAGRLCGLVGGLTAADDASTAYLISMWVAPDCRGSGLADRLVSAVRDWAASQQRGTLYLHVVEHNERARRCYERLGFELTGRRILRPRDGRWELQMRAVLIEPGEVP